MGYFAGLDVSLEETTICIVDDAGTIMREARVASEPEVLVAFFEACGMKMERVGLEACSLTAWLHAGLSEAGLPAICIETRQAKAAMGAMPNKTDRNDARGIAQIMRTGWYRAVHVKSPSCRSWRALLTARRMVLNKRRDVENGIRALLREVGLKVGTPSRKDFPARVRELAADDPVLTSLAGSLLAVIEVMTLEVERLTKRVLDEVKLGPVCRRLMTVPGVGPLTALSFRATIDQPNRFQKSRDVGAHLGLTPRRYQSAVRGGPFAADPQQQVVGLARVGHGHRQAPRHGARPGRGGAQAGGDPAPHMGRRQRVPLGQASRCMTQEVPVSA
jgi:transposase